MRLFTGIKLSDELIFELKQFKKKNNHLVSVKWVKEANLHITTLFIGNVSEHYLEKYIEQINAVIRTKQPFELNLTRIDFSPSNNMIWGYFEKNTVFETLVRDISMKLKIPIRKEIIPHVTIARLKKDKKYYKPEFKEFKISLHVDSVYLWKSSLETKSPKYFELKKFNLS